jgi:hypothetical protein
MALDWTHLYKHYKGQWVALADDETTVIAAGSTAREAREKSVLKGSSDPFLFRVPDTLDAFVGYEVHV